MHDPSYPPIGDPDPDSHVSRMQYHSPDDVPDLSPYNASPPMLPDDRSMIQEALANEAAVMVTDAGQLTMPTAAALVSLPSNLTTNSMPHNDRDEPEPVPPPPVRTKHIPKPEREVQKQADGKYYCTFPGCVEEVQVFNRKCEWRFV